LEKERKAQQAKIDDLKVQSGQAEEAKKENA